MRERRWEHGRDLEVHNMHTYLWSWVSLKPREARKPTCSLEPPGPLKSLCPRKPPSSMGAIWCCSSLGAWREATHVQTGWFSDSLHTASSPLDPGTPMSPFSPISPFSPGGPTAPGMPGGPGSPCLPRGPWSPCKGGESTSNQPSRGTRTS